MATKSKTFDNLNITDIAVQCLQKIRKRDNVSEIKRERERLSEKASVCHKRERKRESE